MTARVLTIWTSPVILRPPVPSSRVRHRVGDRGCKCSCSAAAGSSPLPPPPTRLGRLPVLVGREGPWPASLTPPGSLGRIPGPWPGLRLGGGPSPPLASISATSASPAPVRLRSGDAPGAVLTGCCPAAARRAPNSAISSNSPVLERRERPPLGPFALACGAEVRSRPLDGDGSAAVVAAQRGEWSRRAERGSSDASV